MPELASLKSFFIKQPLLPLEGGVADFPPGWSMPADKGAPPGFLSATGNMLEHMYAKRISPLLSPLVSLP